MLLAGWVAVLRKDARANQITRLRGYQLNEGADALLASSGKEKTRPRATRPVQERLMGGSGPPEWQEIRKICS
jgi:hypothetical protein